MGIFGGGMAEARARNAKYAELARLAQKETVRREEWEFGVREKAYAETQKIEKDLASGAITTEDAAKAHETLIGTYGKYAPQTVLDQPYGNYITKPEAVELAERTTVGVTARGPSFLNPQMAFQGMAEQQVAQQAAEEERTGAVLKKARELFGTVQKGGATEAGMQGYRGNDAMNLDRWYMQMEGNIGTIMREAAVSVYGQDEARSAAIGDLLGDDAVVQRAKELAVNQSENSFVKAKHIKELQDAIDARSASYKAGVKEDIERIDDLVTAGNRTMAAILGVDVSQMGGFIAQLDKSERASVANVMDYTAQLAQRPGMDTAKMQYLVSGRMSWMLGEDGVIDSDKFLTLVDKYGAAGLPDQKGLPKTVLDFMTDPALPAGTWDPVDNLFTMYTGRDSDPVILTIEGLKEIMDAQALEDAKASISTETVPFMNGLKAIQKEVDDGYAREIFPEGEPDSGVTPGKPDAGVTIKKGKTKNKYYRTPEGVLVYTLTADGWKQTKRFTRKEWLRTRLRKEKETEPLSWFGVVQGLR